MEDAHEQIWDKQVATHVTQRSAITSPFTLLPMVTITPQLIEGLTALAHVLYRAASSGVNENPPLTLARSLSCRWRLAGENYSGH
jgi:hypothetical protein